MLRNNRGMTLIEIMIVLVILGGLATILATNLTGSLAKSNVKQARIQMAELGKQLDMFYTDCGFYPTALRELITAPSECSTWGPDPYIKTEKKLRDPWGSEFQYERNGGSYVLTSLGDDRREGGEGYGKDISSEEQ